MPPQLAITKTEPASHPFDNERETTILTTCQSPTSATADGTNLCTITYNTLLPNFVDPTTSYSSETATSDFTSTTSSTTADPKETSTRATSSPNGKSVVTILTPTDVGTSSSLPNESATTESHHHVKVTPPDHQDSFSTHEQNILLGETALGKLIKARSSNSLIETRSLECHIH